MKATNATSLRNLHEKTGQVIERAAKGEVITVLKNGVPVAEIRPLTPRRRRLPDRKKILAKFPKMKMDSGRILEAERR